MFWAITCEAGKRYSQIPQTPFHVSMAALEPKDSLPENKLVSLMIEHGGKEFLLCTLEYERVMQVNLDLQFNKGEEMFFFVNGDGTIHLSGYVEASEDSFEENEVSNCNEDIIDDVEDDIEVHEDDEEELGTSRLLTLDASDEDDSEEDYDPEEDLGDDDDDIPQLYDAFPEDSDDDDEDDDVENDFEDMDSDITSDDAEESADATEKKRKRLEMPGPSSKRSKSTPSIPEFAAPSSSGLSNKKLKRLKQEAKTNNVSMETHANDSDQNDDELNSSIGRTPMPGHSKKSSIQSQASFASPDFRPSNKTLDSAKKNKLQSSNSKETNSKSGERKLQKLVNGIEIEDLKIGHGPVAKKGKFIHVFYVGKLENNEVFDSVKPNAGKPFSFRLGRNEVIKGWDVGLEGMRVGGKRFVKVPPEMGYGKKGNGPIPGNSTLKFVVELKAVT